MRGTAFFAILTITYSLAISSTVFRLLYRARFRKLWWDDFWAAFALINATVLFVTFIRFSYGYSVKWPYESVMVTCRFAIWGARLSVAVTIVRVIATGKSLLISKIMAVIFGLLGVALIVQKWVICRNPADFHLCRNTSNVTGYSDLACSFFADFWLLGAPAYLLWKMRLNKRFHRLLQAIFASEMLVLVTSIVQSVYTVNNNLRAQGIVSHFKVTISLIVCNLLFLVTYVYRLSHNGEESSEGSTTAPSRAITDKVSSLATTDTSKFISESQMSHLTSDFLSSSTHQSSITPQVLYESEPGITEQMWSNVDARRAVSSV